MEPTLREARITDSPAIAEVKRRNGLPMEPWPWLWEENPAVSTAAGNFPPGWVLDCRGGLVGYLGNVPMLYHFGGRTLLAAAARGFVVDAAFRSHSIRLAAAFLSQKNIELLLNTSANVPTSRIFGALKALKVPQPEYDQALMWILRPADFLAAYLRKRGQLSIVASVGGWILAPALHAAIRLGRRYPPAVSGLTDAVRLQPQDIGDEFDELWQSTLRDRPRCLLADRSARSLRWRYAHPAARARCAHLVAVRRRGRLAGYAVVTREDSPEIGLRRSSIVDLLAEHDDDQVIHRLLAEGYESARADGSHVLEIKGFPERIRNRFRAGRPFVRQLPSWEYWYKAVDAELGAALSAADCWYGTPFDGDANL